MFQSSYFKLFAQKLFIGFKVISCSEISGPHIINSFAKRTNFSILKYTFFFTRLKYIYVSVTSLVICELHVA